MGWSIHQAVCHGVPNMIIGNNGNLPSSRMAGDWGDLKEQLRSYRIYLYTPMYPYEDGYNLALLEAMATGMPIATMHHRTSPIRDGSEGVVARTVEELREKVRCLLENPKEAVRLGKGARIRVEEAFPLSEFREAWQSFALNLICTE
jgi:glycosyltransferase involved in cell wall biosynthesis